MEPFMTRRLLSFVCVVALGLAAGAYVVLSTPAPLCLVDGPRTYNFGEAVQLQVWNLKVARLKELKARLLVITNGKLQTAHEVDYEWTDQQSHPPASGQMMLLIKEDPPYGAGKRFPYLVLDLQGLPSYRRSEKQLGVVLDGDLQSSMSTSSSGNSVGPSVVVYSHVFRPKADVGPSFSSGVDTVDSLLAASKEGSGRTILAIALESKPQ
jgi:hypothetical protein